MGKEEKKESGTSATEEGGKLSKGISNGIEQRRHDDVILRVEQIGNAESKFLEYSFFLLMLLVIVYGIIVLVFLLGGFGANQSVPDRSWFLVQLLLLSGGLLGTILLYVFFLYRTAGVVNLLKTHENKQWQPRHKFYVLDAAIVGALAIVNLSAATAAYAIFLTATCTPSETAVSVLMLIRSLTMVGLLMWVTATARLMRVHGPSLAKRNSLDALESGEEMDAILLIDQKWNVILKDEAWFLFGYGVVLVLLLLAFLGRISFASTEASSLPPLDPSCAQPGKEYSCDASTDDALSYAFQSGAIVFYMVMYTYSLRSSWKGQKDLPDSHFKMSKIFLKIQMRYSTLLFAGILVGSVVVGLASVGTCRGIINGQLGSVSAFLSLALYSWAVCLLYTPARFDDHYNLKLFQTIAWLEKDIDGELAKRMDVLQKSNAGSRLATAKYIAKRIGVPDTFGLFNTPMQSILCMEYMVKLFYWTRSSYKGIVRLAQSKLMYSCENILTTLHDFLWLCRMQFSWMTMRMDHHWKIAQRIMPSVLQANLGKEKVMSI